MCASPEFVNELAAEPNVKACLKTYFKQLDPGQHRVGAFSWHLMLLVGTAAFVAPSELFRRDFIQSFARATRSQELYNLAKASTDQFLNRFTLKELFDPLRQRVSNAFHRWREFVLFARTTEYYKTCVSIVEKLKVRDHLDVAELDRADARCQRIVLQMASSLVRHATIKKSDEEPNIRWRSDAYASKRTSADAQTHGWLSSVPGERPMATKAAIQAAREAHFQLPAPCDELTIEGDTIRGEMEAPMATFGMLEILAQVMGWSEMTSKWSKGTEAKHRALCLLGVASTDLLVAAIGDDPEFEANRKLITPAYLKSVKVILARRARDAPPNSTATPAQSTTTATRATPATTMTADASTSTALKRQLPVLTVSPTANALLPAKRTRSSSSVAAATSMDCATAATAKNGADASGSSVDGIEFVDHDGERWSERWMLM